MKNVGYRQKWSVHKRRQNSFFLFIGIKNAVLDIQNDAWRRDQTFKFQRRKKNIDVLFLAVPNINKGNYIIGKVL